ncbi:restriction endonuclease subunit S [Acinetobacter nosocomialis]|uniref:restriction endonuclease subunit S n=1 Tax=Acinetobacter nosocomialis TaxID=106654 RepID=UPI00068F8124|nr:restriction endonuclease subunit S [Acinetobacter nosocomialis]
MREWQDVVIEELCSEITDCVNKTAPSVDYVTPYKMIRTTNIKQGRINLDEVRYVTEETYKTWIRRGAPQLEDIILTREAPVGEVGMIRTSEKVFLGQRTMMYRADRTKADPYFLYYAFQTEAVQEQIHSAGMGSVVEHVRVPDAKKFKINTPPLPEQKAIASVLSSLDDKIDLLHRQNKTLEAMAETLFRQWFIEEAKEGWPVKPLKEICQIINGFAFKSGSYTDSGYKVIRTLNFTNHKLDTNQLVYVSEDTAKEYEKYNLQRKDFLLVMVGASLGNYAIVTKDALPALQNQNMWCFRAFDDCYQNFLNHRLLDVIEENLSGASGSAREFFQKSVFYEVTIAVPPNELLEAYNVEADALFNKMELNRDQIQTLENLRDTLLPKLMSGEVRVQYQTEDVA